METFTLINFCCGSIPTNTGVEDGKGLFVIWFVVIVIRFSVVVLEGLWMWVAIIVIEVRGTLFMYNHVKRGTH